MAMSDKPEWRSRHVDAEEIDGMNGIFLPTVYWDMGIILTWMLADGEPVLIAYCGGADTHRIVTTRKHAAKMARIYAHFAKTGKLLT
jgi:hypothetical protein